MKKIDTPLTVEGKGQKNTQSRRGKMFGYQVLGFGSGGGSTPGIVANGGTITYDGDYAINLFAASGNLVVEKLGDAGDNQVEYVVAAGGGNGSHGGSLGGGGAGGYRANGAYNMTIAVQSYPVVVGSGTNSPGGAGATSSFNSINTSGGGGTGQNGGSGGGAGGSGNAGGYSPPEGNPGGSTMGGPFSGGGGGGGSGGNGQNGGGYAAGPGGPGTVNDITGTNYTYCGGGTGESSNPSGWGPIGPSVQTIYGNGAPSSRGGPCTSADGVVIVRYRSLSTA